LTVIVTVCSVLVSAAEHAGRPPVQPVGSPLSVTVYLKVAVPLKSAGAVYVTVPFVPPAATVPCPKAGCAVMVYVRLAFGVSTSETSGRRSTERGTASSDVVAVPFWATGLSLTGLTVTVAVAAAEARLWLSDGL